MPVDFFLLLLGTKIYRFKLVNFTEKNLSFSFLIDRIIFLESGWKSLNQHPKKRQPWWKALSEKKPNSNRSRIVSQNLPLQLRHSLSLFSLN
jgi:hypothetical protein